MLLFLSVTQFMGAVTIILVKIAFKTYLSSLSLILTMANSKRTVYMCQIQYLTITLERILFSSVVMVLAFRPGVPGSNPVRILYFCPAFIHLFLCYGLSS